MGVFDTASKKIHNLLGMTSLGQKTKANSLGVTLASDQDALPVTDNAGSLTVDSIQLPSTLGQKTKTNSMSVTVASDQGALAGSVADGSNVVEGATADAAVITDAAGTLSGKLRGLVKWAFERMPASLGQKTMAASLPVVVASDQTAVKVQWSEAEMSNYAPRPLHTYGAVHGNVADITIWAGETADWYAIRAANDGDPSDTLTNLTNVGKYFDGGNVAFDTTPIWIYIPINALVGSLPNLYGGFRTFSAFIKNQLGVGLTVTLYAVPDKARLAFGVPKRPIGDSFDYWQIGTAAITSGSTEIFGPNGASLGSMPDRPIGWLVIKAVPASDPGSGYWALAVQRCS